MLKKRLITAVILAVLVILAIQFLSFSQYLLLLTSVMLFSAWEWTVLMDYKTRLARFIYIILVALMMWMVWMLPVFLVLVINFCWWLMALYLIVKYPNATALWSKNSWILGAMGVLVIVPCWLALAYLRILPGGALNVFFCLFLVWSADTGAYFVGKKYGRMLLCRYVSPKKTWEGVYGGVLLTIIIGLFLGYLWLPDIPVWARIMAALIIGFYSIIGDLLESMMKRNVGIKDIGSYLPGHGGLLDRIDGLTASAPMFLLFLIMFTTTYKHGY